MRRTSGDQFQAHSIAGVDRVAFRVCFRAWLTIHHAGYRKMIARLGEAARFSFPVHPHMFHHACGYKLANDGCDAM